MSPAHEECHGGDNSGTDTCCEVSVSVEIQADAEELPAVFEAVEEFGERVGWSMQFVLQAQLVLEEMMLNVMTHSGATDPVVMKLASRWHEAEFEIIDNGMPFDPTEAPTPPEHGSSSLMDMAIGGLGIHLVRSMVQDMLYRRENDVNHLTLVLALSDT